MKASIRQQNLLLTLQDLDNTLARLRRKRATLPERGELEALAAASVSVKTAFMDAQRELDTQRAELSRLENDAETVQKRRERDEQLLAASTSSKEALALQGELDALTRRKSDIEDRELEVMEVVEAAQAAFAKAETELSGMNEKRAGVQQRLETAEQQIDAELSSNTEERAGLAAEVQRDLLDVYEELRGRIGIGAARLRGNVSEGSNMALAPAEIAEIQRSAPDELVFCPGSGAILVRDFTE